MWLEILCPDGNTVQKAIIDSYISATVRVLFIYYKDDISPNKYWGPISWNIFFISMRPSPFWKKGGILLCTCPLVCLSVDLPEPFATDDSNTLYPRSFKFSR